MMTGELEFDNYFAPADLHQSNPLYYPAATLVMFVVFAVVVPIVFMNLLVSSSCHVIIIAGKNNMPVIFYYCWSVVPLSNMTNLASFDYNFKLIRIIFHSIFRFLNDYLLTYSIPIQVILFIYIDTLYFSDLSI